MSSNSTSCIFCKKDCKTTNSRPYPSSKSKEKIHNKCYIKKSLADKKSSNSEFAPKQLEVSAIQPVVPSTKNDIQHSTSSLFERTAKDELDLKKAINERKLKKLEEESLNNSKKSSEQCGQFFYDLKAGIAKPSEKRRYLHHRNLTEFVARYDDDCLQKEAVGRAYDLNGKDLNALDDQNGDEIKVTPAEESRHQDQSKRKYSDFKDESKRDKKKTEQAPCWFCLSSPDVEEHLIIAIGEYCYLALAKGGLSDEHLLLLPIEHIHSLASDVNPKELFAELEKFNRSLVSYFRRRNMGLVFFERNFKSAHWQLQAVPIPLSILDSIEQTIKLTSKNFYKNTDYRDIPPNCTFREFLPKDAPYFYWQIEPLGRSFLTLISSENSFFPIQFGRSILAEPHILNCKERIDWKTCLKTKDEYTNLVRELKKNYRDYNFTLPM